MSRLQHISHPAWVEVDLGAVRHNLRRIRRLVAPAAVLVVVKSNAYGHGLLPLARVASEEGAWGLGVACVTEGVHLRQAGIDLPVLVLGPVLPAEMDEALRHRLALVVFDRELAAELSRRARGLGRVCPVHVKVDTGLGRLSVPWHEAADFVREVAELPGLRIEGVYSHLSDAEGLDQSYTLTQFQRFRQCLRQLEEQGLLPPLCHIAGSAAGMLLPETRLSLVRLGISLYGLWPAEETRLLMLSRGTDLLARLNESFNGHPDPLSGFLRPALSYKTVVIQVKTVPAGSYIGYGRAFQASRDTRVAVLPVGYADGFDRRLSQTGEVLVLGRRARVAGRVCMNLTMIDVTDIAGVEPGEEVVLLGAQGAERVSAEEIARRVGTINYEVVTRIPAHVPRIYKGLEAKTPSEQAAGV